MIKSVRFCNCQSFEDVSFELADNKVNVLVAPNNTGKSIFFKMLKVAASPHYFSRDELKDLIRTGCDSAIAMYQFDDGAIGLVIITYKGVFYKFKFEDDEEFYTTIEPTESFLEHLGLITNCKDFVANIIDTDQDMLLINSDQKGNGDLIRLIAEDSTLGELEEKVNVLIDEYTGYSNKVSFFGESLNTQLSTLQYTDVDRLEREYLNCSLAFELMELLNSVDLCFEAINEYTKDSCNYNEMLTVSDFLIELNSLICNCESVYVERSDDYTDVLDVCCLLSEVCDLLNSVSIVDSIPEFIISFIDFVVNFDNSINKVSTVDVMQDSVYEFSETLFDVMSSISVIEQSLCDLEYSTKQLAEDRRTAAELGEILECPVYGRVVYNGEECLPYCD